MPFMVYRRLETTLLNGSSINDSAYSPLHLWIFCKENIPIHNAIEIIAYCHFDGKIEQASKFETNLCNDLLEQMKSNENLSKRSLALCWIYLKLVGEFTKAILFQFSFKITFNSSLY